MTSASILSVVAHKILVHIQHFKKCIAVISFGVFTLIIFARKLRAKKHDNIPILGTDAEYHPWLGHLPIMIKHRRELHEFMYLQIKKMQYLPLTSISRHSQTTTVVINDPKLVTLVFETEFHAFEKGPKIQERYSDLLGTGIFLSNPPQWKMQRKSAARLFSMRNLKDYMFVISVKYSTLAMHKIMDQLRVHNQSGDGGQRAVIDMHDLLGRFTLDTFCEISFGESANAISSYPAENRFGIAFDDAVERLSGRSLDIFWKLKRALNIGSEYKIHENLKIVKNFINHIIETHHRKNKNKKKNTQNAASISDERGQTGYDLLSLFLKQDPNLTVTELRHICLNFIIAGRDTTRTLCSWFLYEMTKAKHSQMKSKVCHEIDEYRESHSTLKYTDVHHGFKYLEACLCESLRLNPSVPYLARVAKRDVVMPIKNPQTQQPYIIRENDQVLIHTYSYNRNPKLYPNPLQFKPERFMPKGVTTFSEAEYPVFNISPRLCLGRHFAIVEAKVFLYHFITNFEFKLAANHSVTIKPGIILNLENGLLLGLNARNS